MDHHTAPRTAAGLLTSAHYPAQSRRIANRAPAAPAAATVAALHVKAGEQVAAGAPLAELEPAGEAS
jgi:multidrug efflux pump subunit AcrA (membrane-fusion protein)